MLGVDGSAGMLMGGTLNRLGEGVDGAARVGSGLAVDGEYTLMGTDLGRSALAWMVTDSLPPRSAFGTVFP